MDLREGPMRLKVAYTDVSGTLNYVRRDTLFGHESKTTLGWRTTKHLPNSGASQFARSGGDNFGARSRDFSYQGSDTVLHVGNDLELIPDLWLTTGLAAIYTRRESDVSYPPRAARSASTTGTTRRAWACATTSARTCRCTATSAVRWSRRTRGR
jgi:iron complex outermembrane receptor protein